MDKHWGFPSSKHTALSPPILSSCFLLLCPSPHFSMALYSSPPYINKERTNSIPASNSLHFQLKIRKKKQLPAPERPVGEDDIQAAPIRTVPEQRRRGGSRMPEPRRFNDGPVVAVEHELQIRQSPGVGTNQLHDPPHREQSARLNRRPELLHVDLPVQDSEAEMRRFPRLLHHHFRYSGLPPVSQVFVNPSEIFRAGRRICCRRIVSDRVVSRAGFGVIPRGAV